MRQTTRPGVQEPVLSPGLTCSRTPGQSVVGTTPVPGRGQHTPSIGFNGHQFSFWKSSLVLPGELMQSHRNIPQDPANEGEKDKGHSRRVTVK